jgi:acyl-CoA reductase-like NAD-dependent aldehyde dehydrogenase
VSVNAHAAMTAEIPYVGFSGTGQGKDLSLPGFEDDTRIKHVASSQWPVTRDLRMNRGGS